MLGDGMTQARSYCRYVRVRRPCRVVVVVVEKRGRRVGHESSTLAISVVREGRCKIGFGSRRRRRQKRCRRGLRCGRLGSRERSRGREPAAAFPVDFAAVANAAVRSITALCKRESRISAASDLMGSCGSRSSCVGRPSREQIPDDRDRPPRACFCRSSRNAREGP